jgi:hypothetical protein
MLPGLEPKSFWNRSGRSPWIMIIEPLIVAFIIVAVIVLVVAWQNWGQTCPQGQHRVGPYWTAIQCEYDRSPGAP